MGECMGVYVCGADVNVECTCVTCVSVGYTFVCKCVYIFLKKDTRLSPLFCTASIYTRMIDTRLSPSFLHCSTNYEFNTWCA